MDSRAVPTEEEGEHTLHLVAIQTHEVLDTASNILRSLLQNHDLEDRPEPKKSDKDVSLTNRLYDLKESSIEVRDLVNLANKTVGGVL